MKQYYSKLIAVAAIAAMIFILAGCSSKEFTPDLAGTEWIGYIRGAEDADFVAGECVFSQDSLDFFGTTFEYTLHTGQEAYTKASVTEAEIEEKLDTLYPAETFDGDKYGGFFTIDDLKNEDAVNQPMYGLMNAAKDKMVLYSQPPNNVVYLFRKDTDAFASYEKAIGNYIESYMENNDSNEAVKYAFADRVIEIKVCMEKLDGMTEEAAKNRDYDAIFETQADNGISLAEKLETAFLLDGFKVRMTYAYEDEIIASETFDKTGEIREERFRLGN